MFVLMADTHMPMFNGCLIELTTDQRGLIHWCKYYNQYVFSKELKDRPSEFVIDYDVLMDDWLNRKEFAETANTTSNNRSSTSDMGFVIDFGD